MRVFQIGFNKCGTRTIHQYISSTGLTGIHWDRGKLAQRIYANLTEGRPLLEGYEQYSVFSDMEAMSATFHFEAYKLFPYLYAEYPDAVFILNTRDREAWVRSRLAHGDYAARTMRARGIPTQEELIDQWRKDWDYHHARVTDFFKDKGRFFVFDIAKDDPASFNRHIPELTFKPAHYKHHGKTKKPATESKEPTVPAQPHGLLARRQARRAERRKATFEGAAAGENGDGPGDAGIISYPATIGELGHVVHPMTQPANTSEAGSVTRPAVSGIGSCRVYGPLKIAADQGRIASFRHIFPHIHNPLEIKQAFEVMKGRPVPALELGRWMNMLKPDQFSGPRGFDAMTGDSDILVVELSSVRLVTFREWELQINTFRDILLAEHVPSELIQGLYRKPVESEQARQEILKLPLSDMARTIVTEARFREMEAAELDEAIADLHVLAGRPVLFVGVVEVTDAGLPVSQRVLLNSRMANYVQGREDVAFFNPSDFVARSSFGAVMRDLGHYREDFEPEAAKGLAEALASLAARLPARQEGKKIAS